MQQMLKEMVPGTNPQGEKYILPDQEMMTQV